MASTATDLWTETYSDSKGVVRCKRCNHARPTQPAVMSQSDNPVNLADNGMSGLLQALTSASLLKMSNPSTSQSNIPSDPQKEQS